MRVCLWLYVVSISVSVSSVATLVSHVSHHVFHTGVHKINKNSTLALARREPKSKLTSKTTTSTLVPRFIQTASKETGNISKAKKAERAVPIRVTLTSSARVMHMDAYGEQDPGVNKSIVESEASVMEGEFQHIQGMSRSKLQHTHKHRAQLLIGLFFLWIVSACVMLIAFGVLAIFYIQHRYDISLDAGAARAVTKCFERGEWKDANRYFHEEVNLPMGLEFTELFEKEFAQADAQMQVSQLFETVCEGKVYMSRATLENLCMNLQGKVTCGNESFLIPHPLRPATLRQHSWLLSQTDNEIVNKVAFGALLKILILWRIGRWLAWRCAKRDLWNIMTWFATSHAVADDYRDLQIELFVDYPNAGMVFSMRFVTSSSTGNEPQANARLSHESYSGVSPLSSSSMCNSRESGTVIDVALLGQSAGRGSRETDDSSEPPAMLHEHRKLKRGGGRETE